jgi:hypothetical protein
MCIQNWDQFQIMGPSRRLIEIIGGPVPVLLGLHRAKCYKIPILHRTLQLLAQGDY